MSDTQPQFTRAQKRLMRIYALRREREDGINIVRVRFLPDGDVRAYCADGEKYLIAPTDVLLKEALAWNEEWAPLI